MADRRGFLRTTLGGAVVGLAAATGCLRPTQVLAQWPAALFAPRGVDRALADLTGGVAATRSAGIRIRAPEMPSDPRSGPATPSPCQEPRLALRLCRPPTGVAAFRPTNSSLDRSRRTRGEEEYAE